MEVKSPSRVPNKGNCSLQISLKYGAKTQLNKRQKEMKHYKSLRGKPSYL